MVKKYNLNQKVISMHANRKSLSGPAGEHLVLGELLRRGHEAYLAQGETQKGWDIVLLKETGKNIRIQVKSIDWPNEAAINGKFESGFDLLVAVLHDRANTVRYLIIPQPELEPLISAPNRNRDGGQRTLTVGKNFVSHSEKNLSQYEGAWDLFENVKANR